MALCLKQTIDKLSKVHFYLADTTSEPTRLKKKNRSSRIATNISTMAAPSPFGDFGKLSSELRAMIMRQCASRHCAIPLLQASSALHNELIPFLTDDLVLTLDIDPASRWTHIEILNEEGTPWSSGGFNTLIDLASIHHKPATEAQVNRIPFDRLRGLNVDIHAPDPKDPGQLVRGWLQVTRMIDWISPWNCWKGTICYTMGNRLYGPRPWGPQPFDRLRPNTNKNLPDICVRLVGNKTSWWNDADGFQRSIVGPISENMIKKEETIDQDNFHESDACILLQPFQRVRHARSLSMKLPLRLQNLHNPALNRHIQRLSIVGRWQTEFGERMDDMLESQRVEQFHKIGIRTDPDSFEISESLDDPCIDNAFQQVEDTWTIWLDNCLDDLPGSTAAFVRRERFWQWCEAYEKIMCLALEGAEGFYEGGDQYFPFREGGLSIKMVSEDQEQVLRAATNHRLHALEALNPISWATVDAEIRMQGSRNWCRVAWWSGYRNGIPRKSSQEYQDMVGPMTSYDWYEYDTYRGIDFKCLYCRRRYNGVYVSLSDLINTR